MTEPSSPAVPSTPVPAQRLPGNKGLIAAVAVAVVVLAIIGASTGYLLAAPDPVAGDQAGGSPSAGPASLAPTSSGELAGEPSVQEPSTAASRTLGAGNGFPMPDVTHQDFQEARRRLRMLGLGVQIVFADSGDDKTVERTQPAKGQAVRRGVTVRVFVRGMAPAATIPNVHGMRCAEVGTLIADHGLVPEYVPNRSGVVLRLDPEPETGGLRWNDRLRVYCGAPSPSATP